MTANSGISRFFGDWYLSLTALSQLVVGIGMAKIVFKCLQCGRCCRSHLKEVDGALAGLGLFAEEKDLFPSEFVSPHVGIGWGAPSGPKYVVSYQLNVNDCPNLLPCNVCKIYDKRPLVCRAFPLRLGQERDTQIASVCAFVEEVGKRVKSLSSSQLAKLRVMCSKELLAIEEMIRLIDKPIVEYPVDARVIWVFDLRSKAWHVVRVDV